MNNGILYSPYYSQAAVVSRLYVLVVVYEVIKMRIVVFERVAESVCKREKWFKIASF